MAKNVTFCLFGCEEKYDIEVIRRVNLSKDTIFYYLWDPGRKLRVGVAFTDTSSILGPVRSSSGDRAKFVGTKNHQQQYTLYHTSGYRPYVTST